MKKSARCVLVGMVIAAATVTTGCQTYQVGQVLPSAYHWKDDVQYFPKGPTFPLANELNAMQQAETERAEQVP